jgi:hypothetical protein
MLHSAVPRGKLCIVLGCVASLALIVLYLWCWWFAGAYNRTLTPFGFQSEERTLWQAPDIYSKMSPFMWVLLLHRVHSCMLSDTVPCRGVVAQQAFLRCSCADASLHARSPGACIWGGVFQVETFTAEQYSPHQITRHNTKVQGYMETGNAASHLASMASEG